LVRRIGWVTAIAEGGALLGPVYGAGALHIMSWRWIFLLNVPVAIAFAWVLHRTWLPDARRGTAAIDWRGGLLLGAILSCTILAASQEASRLDERVGRPALLAAAILGCAAYALSARRTPEPVLPATLVGGRLMQAVLLTHLLSGMALIAPLILVPLWGNTLMSLEPTQAALLLARLSLTIPIGALLGSRLSGMLPLTIVATAGMLLAGGALELMSAWPVSIDTTTMTGPLLLGGFGFGLMISPTNGLAIQSAGQVHASTAASLVQAARLVGMAVGSAALASFGLDHFNTLVAELTLSDPTAYVEAVRSSAQQVFTRLFHWGALAAVAGSGAALLTWSGKHEPVQPR
jgi:MFS family permease